MINKLIASVCVSGAALLFSCVSSKKYKMANDTLSTLVDRNAQLTEKNNELSQEVATLKAHSESTNAIFAAYKTGCMATQQKYDLYMSVLRSEYQAVQELKNRLVAGMIDFADHGVYVYEKDGRICVNMEEKLLYKSGSAIVGEEGKTALRALAKALGDYPDLKVIVVGHTDDVKFKKGSYADNLTLSTERANGVVRILRDENGVDASRLTAAGQGKYNPIADNGSAEGRAKNRRTEIILNPDLVRLWETAIISNN